VRRLAVLPAARKASIALWRPDLQRTGSGGLAAALALLRSYGETFNAMGKLTSRRLVDLGAALAHPCLPTSPLWAALLPMPLSSFLPHVHARERAASVGAQAALRGAATVKAMRALRCVARRVPNARKLPDA
jgi:hypothetical protein